MAKNIVIYKGPIHKILVERVKLVKDTILPTIQDKMITEESLFYGTYGGFVNMEYDCVLPDYYEAETYMNGVLKIRENAIKNLLSGEISLEKYKQYMEKLQEDTGCVYYDFNELERSFTLPKKEFKELRKSMKKRG